ncbi:hypothetical protein L1I79_05355 [Strepomyces sp. STD 3.1]|uniref:hypothetical protein n=1 Tax=Streptomyces sp. NPDC058985 TaxID=3346684 RepID=UPI001F232CF1|nr:hypothetical protein [Streptomyces sp. STD 3.1]
MGQGVDFLAQLREGTPQTEHNCIRPTGKQTSWRCARRQCPATDQLSQQFSEPQAEQAGTEQDGWLRVDD